MDESFLVCHTNNWKIRGPTTVSSTVEVHWFSEMRRSSCWAKIIKSQSQLELLRHLPVRHQYLEGSQSDRHALTVKVKSKNSERQPVGSAEESWNGELKSLHGAGFLLITAVTRLPRGRDQIKSFMIHRGQLGVKRRRPCHRGQVFLRLGLQPAIIL